MRRWGGGGGESGAGKAFTVRKSDLVSVDER